MSCIVPKQLKNTCYYCLKKICIGKQLCDKTIFNLIPVLLNQTIFIKFIGIILICKFCDWYATFSE